MERNYPKTFDDFWEKVLNGKKVKKTKGARNISAILENDKIVLEMCDEYYDSFSEYDKEGFYCVMLDLYMFPRVKEY